MRHDMKKPARALVVGPLLASMVVLALAPLGAWAQEQSTAQSTAQAEAKPETQAEVTAPGKVQVPVLREGVARGQVIRAENITLQAVDAKQVFASTVTGAEGLVGMQANRNLEAGQPVNRLHVSVASAVRRNSAVTIRFMRGGVELTSQGQALEDGAVGQSVRVLNPATRTTLSGRVSEDGSVQVN